MNTLSFFRGMWRFTAQLMDLFGVVAGWVLIAVLIFLQMYGYILNQP